MTGYGRRFIAAGYLDPKPLIMVDGKPIIEHVLGLMPGEKDLQFVCNLDHRTTSDIEAVLSNLAPQAKIDWHTKKRGPVEAILDVHTKIDLSAPYMVSYCDFGGLWDYQGFKRAVVETNCDAALPAYIGFHPHLLNKALYASMRVSADGWLEEIREKHCFTENPMDCYQQPGHFYFKSGSLMLQYARRLLAEGELINGEFYVSQMFNLMQRDGLKILVYPMPYFCQWGTPEDLEEYEAWSRVIHKEVLKREKLPTAIPSGRESLVQIRYPIDSNEYKLCYHYWSDYFQKLYQLES